MESVLYGLYAYQKSALTRSISNTSTTYNTRALAIKYSKYTTVTGVFRFLAGTRFFKCD